MIRKPAGFWRRLLANILDGLIVGVPLGIISYFIKGDFNGDAITSSISFVYSILIPISWMGYTIGKRLVGVRIVKVNGTKLGIGAMLMRTVVAGLVYGLTLGLAAIVSAFMVGIREDKRSLHDFIAGTYVTMEKP